jgi:ABC-type branched-subunit amino acid transport system substrate-binding protein
VGLIGGLGSGDLVAQAAAAPITICEDLALSGTFSSLGMQAAYGATAYVDAANKTGGFSGHPVKIVQENDQSTPALAATLARKCVAQDHANFVFGPEETSTVTAAVPVLNSLKEVSLVWGSGWNDIGLSAADRHASVFPAVDNAFHELDLDALQVIVGPRHYTRVAIIENSAPGGLGNNTYVESVGKQYGLKVVSTQIASPAATDDTPAVLAMLAQKPQIIIVGLIPGTDSITALKDIRAQSATIPVADCSACDLPDFIAAVGGPSAMQNVYMNGTMTQVLNALPRTAANMASINDIKAYVKDMGAVGLGSANDINDGQNGWQSAEELAMAIKDAGGSIDPSAVKAQLEHQAIATLNVKWDRTPQNYGAITTVKNAVVTINQSGVYKVFGLANGGPGE